MARVSCSGIETAPWLPHCQIPLRRARSIPAAIYSRPASSRTPISAEEATVV